MKGRITKLGAIALATAIGFATVATLVKAADPITDRREAMKANGAAMKAINEVLKNGGAAADLAPHAAKLNDTAMEAGDPVPRRHRSAAGQGPGPDHGQGRDLAEPRRLRGGAQEVPG